MSEEIQDCIECGGATHPIRVVEQDHRQHNTLKYTAIDAKPSWFLGIYPVEGHLTAELCESCGRVTFRAVPKEVAEN
jgi:uncharacterized OB-fold protein